MRKDHGGGTDPSTIDFSVNVNPWGPPKALEETWPILFDSLSRYPPIDAQPAREALGEHLGVPPERIVVGNGASELIDLVVSCFGPRRVWVSEPSYSEYGAAAASHGIDVCGVPMPRRENRFEMDFDAYSLRARDMAFLCSPHNPTGGMLDRESIGQFARRHPGAWIVVDESFMDFHPDGDRRSCVKDASGSILVMRSLTKFYTVPGLRIGYLVTDENTGEELRQHQVPWSVNGPAVEAVRLLLECTEFASASRRKIQRERDRVVERLRVIDGLTVFRSEANFLLLELPPGRSACELNDYLRPRGMTVRDAGTFAGMSSRFFRVGLRRPCDNDRLAEAIADFVMRRQG